MRNMECRAGGSSLTPGIYYEAPKDGGNGNGPSPKVEVTQTRPQRVSVDLEVAKALGTRKRTTGGVDWNSNSGHYEVRSEPMPQSVD